MQKIFVLLPVQPHKKSLFKLTPKKGLRKSDPDHNMLHVKDEQKTLKKVAL